MATKKQTAQTYRELITKSDSQIQTEQIDLAVEQTALNFDQGLLSLKGKMITTDSEVKQAQSNLNKANAALQKAKASQSGNIVQELINARTNVLQAEADLLTKQEEAQAITDMFTFISNLKSELFPA